MSLPSKLTGSLAFAALHRELPELRKLGPDRTLAIVGAGIAAGYHPASRPFVRFAGRFAQERGCATSGPVQIGPSTWAHRCADGRTLLWHRRPTAAEVRALTGGRPAARAARRPTRQAAIAVKPSAKTTAAAQRVARLFR